MTYTLKISVPESMAMAFRNSYLVALNPERSFYRFDFCEDYYFADVRRKGDGSLDVKVSSKDSLRAIVKDLEKKFPAASVVQ